LSLFAYLIFREIEIFVHFFGLRDIEVFVHSFCCSESWSWKCEWLWRRKMGFDLTLTVWSSRKFQMKRERLCFSFIFLIYTVQKTLLFGHKEGKDLS
jgi:hypothetical protein